jgi:carbon-monoxide dehydrogenase small subunit
MSRHEISLVVNGETHAASVEARVTLADFLRRQLGQTGTHLACEHGVCGACTVIVDGRAVRGCLMLAVQANGREVRTVEGLAGADGALSRVQEAMRAEYALQCGFCTPGIVMTLTALTAGGAQPSEDELIGALGGHLCRCTGYQGLMQVARRLSGAAA